MIALERSAPCTDAGMGRSIKPRIVGIMSMAPTSSSLVLPAGKRPGQCMISGMRSE